MLGGVRATLGVSTATALALSRSTFGSGGASSIDEVGSKAASAAGAPECSGIPQPLSVIRPRAATQPATQPVVNLIGWAAGSHVCVALAETAQP
jgi:hypothetical protein